MSKLKNIKAVNEILAGTHKTQTRKTHGFSDTDFQNEKNKKREVGEIWAEVNAKGETVCWWTQKDGYRVKSNVHPNVKKQLDDVLIYLKAFPNCQKETCTCKAPSRLDEKFRKLMGMCEDCVFTMETRLKIEGKFNEYALNKLQNNADSYFKEADKELEILKKSLETIGFVDNEHGDVENWTVENLEELKRVGYVAPEE